MAESDLSIPDQRRQLEAYCEARGWQIAGEFIDAASGTDDNRPQLQRLLDIAAGGDAPFDVVISSQLFPFCPATTWILSSISVALLSAALSSSASPRILGKRRARRWFGNS